MFMLSDKVDVKVDHLIKPYMYYMFPARIQSLLSISLDVSFQYMGTK